MKDVKKERKKVNILRKYFLKNIQQNIENY